MSVFTGPVHPATGRGAFAFSWEGLAHDVALGPDDIHHFIHILLAGLLLRCFHHDAEDRLRAGFPDENAASVAQLFGYLLDFGLHVRVRLGGYDGARVKAEAKL